jgi:hypothetical protein
MNMNSWVYALTTLPNGDLIAGGDFTTAGGVPANRIARWNGSAWSALGSGMNSDVYALTTLPSGDLIAGGGFTTAGGVVAPYIARWGCPPPTACNPADIADTSGRSASSGGGPDGAVENGDFTAFFAAFFAAVGNPLRPDADIADSDGVPGADGAVDNGDYTRFFFAFFDGCP